MKRIHFNILLFCFLLHAPAAFALDGNRFPEKLDTTIKPGISKALYGETGGQQIYQYTLRNTSGMQVKVINYGASITDIIMPDKNGRLGSVVLGFDSLSSYTGRNNALMGAVVGRTANRIADKKFELDGKEYVLSSYIHGGQQGFDKKVWKIKEVPGTKEVALELTYLSKDGEEGYPGNLNVTIRYTLTDHNELKIDYTAKTDKATPVILTNHTYFNLSGEGKVLNTEIIIAADKYLETGKDQIPTGNIPDVKNTPFDFTSSKKIGERIADTKNANGYDLTFSLRNQGGKLKWAATAVDSSNGRKLEVYTTEPGLVFYTANHLNEGIIGRAGKPFTKYGAFCFETQHYPDSPNHPKFPNTIVRPGETFSSQTVYKFSVNK